METAILNTPVGSLQLSGDAFGISSILYLNEESQSTDIPESLQECAKQLEEYFAGKRTEFNLRINPQGTEFQKRVWAKLAEIPFGEVISYLELSRRIGDTKAIRAVGHANGKNRINIVIPCHRVIGSNKKLIGYGGGLWRKEWLLKHEAGNSMPGLFSL